MDLSINSSFFTTFTPKPEREWVKKGGGKEEPLFLQTQERRSIFSLTIRQCVNLPKKGRGRGSGGGTEVVGPERKRGKYTAG